MLGRFERLLPRRPAVSAEKHDPVAIPELAPQWERLSSHGHETLHQVLTRFATPGHDSSRETAKARVQRVVACLNGIQPPYYPLPHTDRYQETTQAASRAIEHELLNIALGGKDPNTREVVADLAEISVALRDSRPQSRASRV